MAQVETVNTMLKHWADLDPDKPAFIFRSSHPTYNRFVFTRRDLYTLGSRYAAILRQRGVRQGDVVCNTLPNSPERLVTDMGIMLAGAVTMSGMVFLADGEDLMSIIRRSKCVAVVLGRGLSVNALTALQSKVRTGSQGEVVCAEAPLLKALLHVDCAVDKLGKKPFLEELHKLQETFVADVEPSDTAFIFTTSGSTGFSKLVPRSHGNFLAVGENFYRLSWLRPEDVDYNDRSLGRISGAPTIYVSKGVTRVMLDESERVTDNLQMMWDSIRSEHCTTALTIPMLLDASMSRPELWKEQPELLRVIVIGGQPIRKQQMEAIGRVTDSIAVTYGSTECGFVTVHHITADNKASFEDGNNGLPLPAMEVKLVDENLQDIHKAGEAGEVLCRGPTVFAGYLGLREEQNQENVFTEDGWFRSNDVAYFNEQGELHVVCRMSNAINHGAFIVYPGWLEVRLERCPGVRSVVIVPVPDPIVHQELCACVVPKVGAKVTAAEVQEFCRSLFLTPDTSDVTQIPRYYEFFDSFPTTSTGKIDRKTIKKIALERLGM